MNVPDAIVNRIVIAARAAQKTARSHDEVLELQDLVYQLTVGLPQAQKVAEHVTAVANVPATNTVIDLGGAGDGVTKPAGKQEQKRPQKAS